MVDASSRSTSCEAPSEAHLVRASASFTLYFPSLLNSLHRSNAIFACAFMASLTFGSVGDIVTVCGIIIDVVKALSESRGSAADYQGLIRELWSLAQVLESVGSLLEEHSWLPNHGRLETILQNCKRCLDHYLKQIKAFEPSLGQNTPRVSAKDIYRKVRWLSRKVFWIWVYRIHI